VDPDFLGVYLIQFVLHPGPPAKEEFYFNIENLVLWARSEKIAFAADLCRGVMEYWSVGILGLVEVDLFLYGWCRAENNPLAADRF